MKRKRTNTVEQDPHKRDSFYNKDELLHHATCLQLDYNRLFGKTYDDLSILRYIQEQTELETIAKITIILSACVNENIYKSLDEIKKIINTTTINSK